MSISITGRVVVWYLTRGSFSEASRSFRDFDAAISGVFGYCDVFTDPNESYVFSGGIRSRWWDYLGCDGEAFNFYRADGAHINPVLVAARAAVLEDARERRRALRRMSKGGPYVFRSGPVPGTQKYRWGRSRTFRYPATLQERRWNDSLRFDDDIVEYGVVCRGRRSAAMLPTVRDDVMRGDQDQRSWKRQRRHQWK